IACTVQQMNCLDALFDDLVKDQVVRESPDSQEANLRKSWMRGVPPSSNERRPVNLRERALCGEDKAACGIGRLAQQVLSGVLHRLVNRRVSRIIPRASRVVPESAPQ